MPKRWVTYNPENKLTYVNAIQALGSISSLFRQKSDDPTNLTTYISSKYQETAFARSFGGKIVDRGNDPYDVMIASDLHGKYDLVGIKTFLNSSSRMQKIMQFKAVANDEGWPSWISNLEFEKLIRRISAIRNQKLMSTQSALAGPHQSISHVFNRFYYHYLSPAKDGTVYVGETSYDLIDESALTFEPPSAGQKMTSLWFSDGRHEYKYTPADSTLYMEFKHREFAADGGDLVDEFYVQEVQDPYDFLLRAVRDEIGEAGLLIARQLPALQGSRTQDPSKAEQIEVELPERRLVELDLGQFAAGGEAGSKTFESAQSSRIADVMTPPYVVFPLFRLTRYRDVRAGEVNPRSGLNVRLGAPKNRDSSTPRPKNEVEIQIPKARRFHEEFPEFFGVSDNGTRVSKAGRDGRSAKLLLDEDQRTFKLVLTSSNVSMEGLLTGDHGKQIMSRHSQEILGSWILDQVFQLGDYEMLTRGKLDALGLDGIKLSRLGNREIGLDFVKVQEEDLEFLWPREAELFTELATPLDEEP